MFVCGESLHDLCCELELTRQALRHVQPPQTLPALCIADHAHFNHRAASSNLPGDGSKLCGYNFLPGVQEERWVCRD